MEVDRVGESGLRAAHPGRVKGEAQRVGGFKRRTLRKLNREGATGSGRAGVAGWLRGSLPRFAELSRLRVGLTRVRGYSGGRSRCRETARGFGGQSEAEGLGLSTLRARSVRRKPPCEMAGSDPGVDKSGEEWVEVNSDGSSAEVLLGPSGKHWALLL